MPTLTRIVTSALSEDEYQALRKLAFDRGRTRSAVIRAIIVAALEIPGEKSILPGVVSKIIEHPAKKPPNGSKK